MYHRVLVTGANGLVGQAVVRRFSEVPEIDLFATGREDAPRFPSGAGGYAPLDVTDEAAVLRVFEDFAPTEVVHLAAMSSVEACEADREACWRTNVDSVGHVVAAARLHGTRVILASTDFVFSGEDGPYAEDARPAPVNFYGRSKLAAENLLRSSGPTHWAIVRTALVFGLSEPPTRGTFLTFLLRELGAGREVQVAGDQVRTPTLVDDLAHGLERLIRFRKEGVYHLAGREIIPVRVLARTIADVFELDADLITETTTEALHPGAPRPLDTPLLILKAESELGFRPTPLREALERLRDERR